MENHFDWFSTRLYYSRRLNGSPYNFREYAYAPHGSNKELYAWKKLYNQMKGEDTISQRIRNNFSDEKVPKLLERIFIVETLDSFQSGSKIRSMLWQDLLFSDTASEKRKAIKALFEHGELSYCTKINQGVFLYTITISKSLEIERVEKI